MIVCAKNYSYCAIFVQAILKCNRAPVFGRPLQVTVRLMLWDRCLVYLSVTLVYCGQTVGWIKMPLGTEVGLCPCDTVLDGDPAPLTEWGTAAPPPLFGHVCSGQTVAHLINCWALVWNTALNSYSEHVVRLSLPPSPQSFWWSYKTDAYNNSARTRILLTL